MFIPFAIIGDPDGFAHYREPVGRLLAGLNRSLSTVRYGLADGLIAPGRDTDRRFVNLRSCIDSLETAILGAAL